MLNYLRLYIEILHHLSTISVFIYFFHYYRKLSINRVVTYNLDKYLTNRRLHNFSLNSHYKPFNYPICLDSSSQWSY